LQHKITVFIVDDHPVVRAGVRELLGASPGIEVLGDAGEAGDATLTQIVALRVAVVVTDIKLPGRSGTDLCRAIKSEPAAPRVVLLSAFWDDALIANALDAGADGYVLKHAEQFDLVRAVRAVAGGEPYFDPSISAAIVRQSRDARAVGMPRDKHAIREEDVRLLHLVAEGLSNREIGELLFLSPHSVRDRLSAIMARLGAGNRAQAVRIAMRGGLM
jgi:DNA-binding NarL/FixJ family response regulator